MVPDSFGVLITAATISLMLRRSFLMGASASATSASQFQIATFQADITPPIGSPLFTGPARSIVDPLEVRGIALSDAGQSFVIAAVDWCEIRNNSYDLWRSTLAEAAGTTRERVLLSCVHQHDAPYTDVGAQHMLDEVKAPDKLCDAAFERNVVQRVAGAVRAAAKRTQTVTHIGATEARVEQVASNRRYVLADGKVSFGRTSATRDPAIREMPEGLIDPMLKTISFFNGSKPIAVLNCYSTHPMSYYGQGNVSADFVGMARRRMQAETPGVFQIYFSGASGDIMAGRYNDGSPGNRPVLAGRLHKAMSDGWRATKPTPLNSIGFRNARLNFLPRRTKGFTVAEMYEVLEDPKAPRRARLDAALGLSWNKRLDRKVSIDVPALHFKSVSIVLVPAEAFVQYQLWAQQMRPKSLMMTLGFGECAPGYIPTNAAVSEGYDGHYSWVDFSHCEEAFRAALQHALASD